MKKAIMALILLVVLWAAVYLSVPKGKEYEASYYDVFDTYSTLTVYCDSEEKAREVQEAVHTELLRLHRLYDRYNSYEGVTNLKTLNDSAGIAPITVDGELMELLDLSKQVYGDTGGAVNAGMGSVLEIWHSYREAAEENPENAAVPTRAELEEAALHTDMSWLTFSKEENTAYITDGKMSVDCGAIAKGLAADKAAELLRKMDIDCAMINLGGNIALVGGRNDGSPRRIGIQNPRNSKEASAVIEAADISVVTSGDYQRYYTVEGKRYNHIIDPSTLMPGDRYASVTVAANSSAIGDMLSTALFILPEEEGDVLAQKYSARVCRIYKNGEVKGDSCFKASN